LHPLVFADLSERSQKKKRVLSIFAPLQHFTDIYLDTKKCIFAPAKMKTTKTFQFAKIVIFISVWFYINP
jgi:hypothetical protein